jgi:hypothetical protein
MHHLLNSRIKKGSTAHNLSLAGLVRVKDPRRLYCFGASALRGARICDTALPDYTKLHDEDRGHDVYELYGKKFAYIPYYHRAQYTGADEPAQGKLKV